LELVDTRNFVFILCLRCCTTFLAPESSAILHPAGATSIIRDIDSEPPLLSRPLAPSAPPPSEQFFPGGGNSCYSRHGSPGCFRLVHDIIVKSVAFFFRQFRTKTTHELARSSERNCDGESDSGAQTKSQNRARAI
jgi:hypothetical protein